MARPAGRADPSDTVIGTATLLLPLYPPAIIAKQVADLDRDCGGRLAIGVGVGGEYAADFAAVEVPIERAGQPHGRVDGAAAALLDAARR